MSGKTVLVFGGLMLAVYPGLSTISRAVGWANAVGMILGQLWYSNFWSIGRHEGADYFMLNKPGAHALTDFMRSDSCNIGPAVWMFAASLYYLAFLAAFFVMYSQETHEGARAYAFAAGVWHSWDMLLLLYAAALQSCGMSFPRDDVPPPLGTAQSEFERV